MKIYPIIICMVLAVLGACKQPVSNPIVTPEFVVNFIANGGSPAPVQQTVSRGSTAC